MTIVLNKHCLQGGEMNLFTYSYLTPSLLSTQLNDEPWAVGRTHPRVNLRIANDDACFSSIHRFQRRSVRVTLRVRFFPRSSFSKSIEFCPSPLRQSIRVAAERNIYMTEEKVWTAHVDSRYPERKKVGVKASWTYIRYKDCGFQRCHYFATQKISVADFRSSKKICETNILRLVDHTPDAKLF